MNDAESQLLTMLRTHLELLSISERTRSAIDLAVQALMPAVKMLHPNSSIDIDSIKDKLEKMLSIVIGTGSGLKGRPDKIPWLTAERKKEIAWSYWDRYQRLLVKDNFPQKPLEHLDISTNEILALLEDPTQAGAWDVRGMVVGQVQSGKTGNFIGLINKAADAGYKFIVVLAGLHNSLRSQTQCRIDEGFIGCDTGINHRLGVDSSIGVGRLVEGRINRPIYGTRSVENGDFNTRQAQHLGVSLQNTNQAPVILVIKKNVTPLRNLITWVETNNPAGPGSEDDGKNRIRNVPMLVIDDEADQASINTLKPDCDENGEPLDEQDATKINGQIRRLLYMFEQSAYIGYTATPYANIFINSFDDVVGSYSDQDRELACGKDLFPFDFIRALPAPSNYCGPVEVFGLSSDREADAEEVEALPLLETITDHINWIGSNHKSTSTPMLDKFPPSLRDAICCFVLACAARRIRKQENKHSTMLIHVTRFTAVQREVKEQCQTVFEAIKNRILNGDGQSPDQIRPSLREIWAAKFQANAAVISGFEDGRFGRHPEVSWDQINGILSDVVSEIKLMTINGTSDDALEYNKYKESGLKVIAIGGDKLSRGLTLDGLCVSYYLRTSGTYDTLMQMSRWFGYRPDYLDLCRLYTTDDLISRYRHIVLADYQLRNEFDVAAAEQKTPKEFALRVRAHPEGVLLVTARNRMYFTKTIDLSYSNAISETVSFDLSPVSIQANKEAVDKLFQKSGALQSSSRKHIERKVPFSRVLEFLMKYKTSASSIRCDPKILSDYISNQAELGFLTNWTVVLLANGMQGDDLVIAGGLSGKPVDRTIISFRDYRTASIKRILSPSDEELIGITDSDRARAIILTQQDFDSGSSRAKLRPTKASQHRLRYVRSPKEGLLLIYAVNLKKPEPNAALAGDDPCATFEERLWSERPVFGFGVSFPRIEGDRKVRYTMPNKEFVDGMTLEEEIERQWE